jgi:hypothetical protein
MEKHIKWVGAALIAGGLLMFTRMAPIFAVLPEDMAFPPASTEEMVRLAGIAGSRWKLSHIMGIAAVVLFAAVYAWHARYLVHAGWKKLGPILAVTAMLAFGLFSIALVIDGFFVPATIESYVTAGEGQAVTIEDVADAHKFALRFFTPGVFLMFVAVGLLSSPMLHRAVHSRWLGVFGQVIAISAVTAFLAGVTGPNWNNLQIAGTLMMAAFAWHLIVGVRALWKGVAS